jgi:D-3-phosphoglycerate dehydrogenase
MTDSKPSVVVTDYTFTDLESERQIVEAAGGLLTAFQCRTEEDVIRHAAEADGLLVQWAPITRSVIRQLRNCKVIVRYGIGLDNVDLEAAQNHGISVCNVPDYCIDEVADHTMALALTLLRQIAVADRELRNGQWNPQPEKPIPSPDSMVFATIGFGRTAQAVLSRARSFRFRLATFDPFLSPSMQVPDDVAMLDADALLASADILSLHAPLNKQTHHLINEARLARMKSHSLLINTARGGLIDTNALATALRKGTIAGAGLDVFEEEPLALNHPLRACTNLLITPHVAWYSEQSIRRLQRMAAEEVVRPLMGQDVRNKVV